MQSSTLTFLSQLGENNNKVWFEANKAAYEAAKADFEQAVTAILTGLSVFEPAFKEQKAKDCIFRIYRDVRFAKDKSPYKANFGAFFNKDGRKSPGAGYYVHLEPGKSFAGGGLWMPESNILKMVRQEIDYNLNEFKAIVEDKSFKAIFGELEGERLKSVPKDYPADHAAGEYLKLKSYVVMHQMKDKEIATGNFTDKCMEVFTAMQSFIHFLNRANS